jgi:hypothetical protein
MEIEKEKLKSFLLDLDLITLKKFVEMERLADKNNEKVEEVLIAKEILEEEEKWETPTFLRKALHKNDKKDKKDNN